MKWITLLSFVLTTFEICMSTATEILYVLPDNSTDAASCPSQPCATLSQYLLYYNNTLPVVSNVEYHFLPGEHHVPANMTLQDLHNFSIIGRIKDTSSPLVVLIGCSPSSVMNIITSHFVYITNVVFKHCGMFNTKFTNLKLSCCFSCKIENVTFLQYGFTAINLIGETYLHNINIEIIESSELCCQVISLEYTTCSFRNSFNNNMNILHNVTISQLLIHDNLKCIPHNIGNVGLHFNLRYSIYHVYVLLANSHFCNMDRTALAIRKGCSSGTTEIVITNSTFALINADPVINIYAPPVKQSINFVNTTFHKNTNNLIVIEIAQIPRNIGCKVTIINNAFNPLNTIDINIKKCQFSNNKNRLLTIENQIATDKANLLLESLDILENTSPTDLISINKINVDVNGFVNFINNRPKLSVIKFKSCDVSFSGSVKFLTNYCNQLISLDTRVKVMEYTNITFSNNRYRKDLIAVDIIGEYSQPYPFCLFQYIAMNSNTSTKDLLDNYAITFYRNYYVNGSKYVIQNNTYGCSASPSFCHFISHCKWLSSGAFYNYNSKIINKKIIKNHDQNYCNYHTQICLRQSKEIDCRTDILGSVYPGQTLQKNFYNMCSNDNSTVLYAEVHNINLPSSACNIAHHSQLINFIGNHSHTVNYTIVLTTPNNDRCELFLTASPFLNKVYDTFYVQLLPCPVGFTLQDGVCDCDPILPKKFYNCYIDYAAIRRPANTWITAHSQANNTKYLISDCPMDYCLPYSSNVNLLHPDLQCQFNRTGILCSQCQHHLSMVFGSSRCKECNNLYILITIMIIVAGIVLVVLLYLLNLTVTIGTISGIIFYANIISINDSVFLVNDNVFKPLRVFISFASLDIGIETCFYSRMSMYVKVWLLLFFPSFLIIMAFTIIIASRYSSRILRLTYTRSLPVLATLFLLSYTGVLRTVLTVLFSYSTITHLPSGHKQIVWSIDASVPLFGLKFTILFITCLVLFLLLIPFNVILSFTNYLLKFRSINHFKPLLDAFQGSCKDGCYHWVAIHINLRSIFFALYGFQMKPRLIIATLILVLLTGYHGYIRPNKNKLVNIQEHLLLINLTILYAVSYQGSENVFCIVTNVMISLAFIQFCTIVLYHFLTYTCHCNVVIMLQAGKQKIMKYFSLKKNICQNLNHLELLDIPERTYDYTEYQDGLVSDDFR